MANPIIKYTKVRDVKTPTYGTNGSNGLDFYLPNDFKQTQISLNKSILVPSGIKMNIPDGWCLLGVDKSGVATKRGLTLMAKLIDSDYRGEIHIHLCKTTHAKDIEYETLNPGDKIAQFILIQAPQAQLIEVSEEEFGKSITSRGSGGFGSTGEK